MALTVRPAQPEDLEALVHGNAEMARESEGKKLDVATLRAGVAALLADAGKGRYFVAEADGQFAGQLMITYEWSDWRCGWFWWIQSVYVAHAARGQGVYRRLHEHVAALARQAGDVVGLRLYVEENNHRAQRVYQRCGMAPAHYHVMEQPL